MTQINLPLSGAVTQTFPWSIFTINLGESSNPDADAAATIAAIASIRGGA